ncbi:MAG: hypothetical protein WCE21_04620 [Candidatus Babeliales bacterium]
MITGIFFLIISVVSFSGYQRAFAADANFSHKSEEHLVYMLSRLSDIKPEANTTMGVPPLSGNSVNNKRKKRQPRTTHCFTCISDWLMELPRDENKYVKIKASDMQEISFSCCAARNRHFREEREHEKEHREGWATLIANPQGYNLCGHRLKGVELCRFVHHLRNHPDHCKK